MNIPDFRACQILCLEHKDTRLYAEVIQVMEARQRCWVRPLILVISPAAQSDPTLWPEEVSDRSTLYDLRQGADLLWPMTLFRVALDTEVLPLLARLESQELPKPAIPPSGLTARHQLNQFVQQVWQAHLEVFQGYVTTSSK